MIIKLNFLMMCYSYTLFSVKIFVILNRVGNSVDFLTSQNQSEAGNVIQQININCGLSQYNGWLPVLKALKPASSRGFL